MQATESSPSLLESMLPDSMLLAVASYLEGDDLLQLVLVSKKFHGLNEDLEKDIWKDICHKRWNYWPKYKWENLQKSKPQLVSTTWKQRYLWVEKDRLRTRLTHQELETGQWYFNFKESAGGRGPETLQNCSFRRGALILHGWPALQYRLVDGEQGQTMIIHEFPPHMIQRVSDGEWMIQNENVYMRSYHAENQILLYEVFKGLDQIRLL